MLSVVTEQLVSRDAESQGSKATAVGEGRKAFLGGALGEGPLQWVGQGCGWSGVGVGRGRAGGGSVSGEVGKVSGAGSQPSPVKPGSSHTIS